MKYLTEKKLRENLEKISCASVGIVADFCVDMYWHADMTISELSRETPHHPLPIVAERTGLGAGGNVAANLKAIGLKNVYAVTLRGNDWRGLILQKLIEEAGINGRFLAVSENFTTSAYCKPLRKGVSDTVYEDPRLDFENREPLTAKDEDALIANIEALARLVDVIVVSDQFKRGVVTDKVRAYICRLAEKKTVLADSRDRIALYTNVTAKPNEVELFRVFRPGALKERIGDDTVIELGARLQRQNGRPTVVTAGARGAFLFGDAGYELFPVPAEEPPIDIVGAGDAFLSALTACRAAGVPWNESIETAHLCTGVTIKKLNTTGTASPDEILAKLRERTA
ncbi:hypothetical protein FACS1894211_09060 [Clostridia bacterium]|nr:hypothetical protein FACS1894211_09060 [Clostridia bacterium]